MNICTSSKSICSELPEDVNNVQIMPVLSSKLCGSMQENIKCNFESCDTEGLDIDELFSAYDEIARKHGFKLSVRLFK